MPTGGKTSPEIGGKGRTGSFLAFVRGTVSLLDWSGRLIAGVCLAAMFAALLINVILRYAFGTGISWAYEIHAILLPWLVAGGLVMASAKGRNIAVTLMSDMLSGRARLGINLAIQLAVLVVTLSVLWSSQPILKASQFQTLSTLGIKQVWGYSSIAYAFSAMPVIAALGILRTLAGEDISGLPPEDTSLS